VSLLPFREFESGLNGLQLWKEYNMEFPLMPSTSVPNFPTSEAVIIRSHEVNPAEVHKKVDKMSSFCSEDTSNAVFRDLEAIMPPERINICVLINVSPTHLSLFTLPRCIVAFCFLAPITLLGLRHTLFKRSLRSSKRRQPLNSTNGSILAYATVPKRSYAISSKAQLKLLTPRL
jgi:hypothetical protein